MRVYSLALFKKTKANKANESLFVCARRIIMAELPNNEKRAKKPSVKRQIMQMLQVLRIRQSLKTLSTLQTSRKKAIRLKPQRSRALQPKKPSVKRARRKLKKKPVQNASAKRIVLAQSVQMLLRQSSAKRIAKSALNKQVVAETATVVTCGF